MSDGKLRLIPVGYGTESEEIIKASVKQKIEHLDYEVMIGEKLIALIEITCTRYSFEGSKFFLINTYKVDRPESMPIYYVYSLEREQCDLADRCWWITREKLMNNLLEPNPTWLDTKRPGGMKKQHNYIVNKHAWSRGLQSLIEELLKSKQTTLG